MKRWLSLLLVFAMTFSLCGGINLTAYADGTIEIADESQVVSPETLDEVADTEEPEEVSGGSIDFTPEEPEDPDAGVITIEDDGVGSIALADGEQSAAKAVADNPNKTVLAFTSDTHNKSDNTAANRLGTWIDTVEGKVNDVIDVMAFGGDMADANASRANFWVFTQADMDQLDNRSVTGV
jgi:hypothetical protein